MVSISIANAQTFSNINAGLVNVGRGTASWADYDNDRDLDLLVTGRDAAAESAGKLYRNDAGTFTDSGAAIESFEETAVSWGDYDADGDLDLLISGNTESGNKTIIYRNDDGSFTDIEAGLVAVEDGDVCWGDYDNDGDLDVFVTGSWRAKLYRNDSGSFIDTEQDFGFWSSSSMDWGDFDNDGDLDILLSGDSGAGSVTKVFENIEGTYVDYELGLPGLMAGTTDWVDLDSDGDMDIALSGYNDALEANFLTYTNNGDGTFTDYWPGLSGIALSGVDWGDLDHDGDLDLVMSGNGTGCGIVISGIYTNEDGFFTEIAYQFETGIRCDLQWGDYDNDGDLDFAIAAFTYEDVPFTKIYRNDGGDNLFTSNTVPTAPTNPLSEVTGNAVNLSWGKADDMETPQDGLSYNLRIGITPGGDEIMSCMSDGAVGFRKISGLGNTCQDIVWEVRNLGQGTYYWSVQAIDQAYAGSPFAGEQTFAITVTGLDETPVPVAMINFYPNPAGDYLEVQLPEEDNREMLVEIYNTRGSVLVSEHASGNTLLDISTLPAGIYLLSVDDGTRKQVQKFLKK